MGEPTYWNKSIQWCELLRRPGTSRALVTGVGEGRLAFALARQPISDPALDVLPVMSERLGAVVPADRLAERDSVAPGRPGRPLFRRRTPGNQIRLFRPA
ncbi:LysR substrate-binding domain-containing protein [Streptomyces sp. R41]|uniref:LysR substrate-binding domain-containing protein n=1 Tax=Streptomyces sp. R41 TaxID=3238632 RepID=A0AB39RRB6_9ACTN